MILDISKHQGKIDWAKLAPSLYFVILKATGDLERGVDPMFHANAKACQKYGIPFHAYCFTRAKTASEARDEAWRLYDTARVYRPVSYILDLEGETLSSGRAVEIANAFFDELRKQGAQKVGLYTGHFAYLERGLDKVRPDFLWIARYGANTGGFPDEKHRPVPCDLWQYTSQLKVHGITENTVDANVLWGDKPLSYFMGGESVKKVLIGSARIDENKQAHGGKPGDQTGGEVSTQEWYKHKLGWRVFRPKSSEAAEKIARCMEYACANEHIGYDQYDRLTLYAVAEAVDFDCSQVMVDVETDCSALVRVCCEYAGIPLGNFNTETEPSVLAKSGAFDEMVGPKYTDYCDRLRRGDILVSASKGHTAVVLTDGELAYDTGLPTLRRGNKDRKGEDDVKRLQLALLAHGYSVGLDGADGDFGKNTETAVKAFQKANGLKDDGIVGPATWAALNAKAPTYTITIHGVDKPEMEKMRERWPECEVTEE